MYYRMPWPFFNIKYFIWQINCMLPQPSNAVPRKSLALTMSPEDLQLCCAVCLLPYSRSAQHQHQQPQHWPESRGYNPHSTPQLFTNSGSTQFAHSINRFLKSSNDMGRRVIHIIAHWGLWVDVFEWFSLRLLREWELVTYLHSVTIFLTLLFFLLYFSDSHSYKYTQEEWEWNVSKKMHGWSRLECNVSLKDMMCPAANAGDEYVLFLSVNIQLQINYLVDSVNERTCWWVLEHQMGWKTTENNCGE